MMVLLHYDRPEQLLQQNPDRLSFNFTLTALKDVQE